MQLYDTESKINRLNKHIGTELSLKQNHFWQFCPSKFEIMNEKKNPKKLPRKRFMESLINLNTYLLSDESDSFRMKLCHNVLLKPDAPTGWRVIYGGNKLYVVRLASSSSMTVQVVLGRFVSSGRYHCQRNSNTMHFRAVCIAKPGSFRGF